MKFAAGEAITQYKLFAVGLLGAPKVTAPAIEKVQTDPFAQLHVAVPPSVIEPSAPTLLILVNVPLTGVDPPITTLSKVDPPA